MTHKAATQRFTGPEMWLLSLATMVLAVGALLIIMPDEAPEGAAAFLLRHRRHMGPLCHGPRLTLL